MLAMKLVRAICSLVNCVQVQQTYDGPSVMKNCESFVFLVPLLAMATSPRCAKRSRGWISSSNGSAHLVSSGHGKRGQRCTSVERLSACSRPCFVPCLNQEARDYPKRDQHEDRSMFIIERVHTGGI